MEELKKHFVTSTGSPLVTLGSDTVGLVVKLVLGLVITLAALFFMFAEGNRILSAAIRLSPLEEKYVLELVAEFDRVCRAVVAATLLSALAQGLLAGIGFYFAGLASSIALLVMLTILLAMVPFTGAAAVWLPVALYLYFVEQKTTSAILLAVYGAAVVSTVDNFIKPVVLHGQSKLHPLLALLSVIGGIQALGPIGILVGPMVVVFLQTLLKILQRELLSMDSMASGGLKAAWASATASGSSSAVATEGDAEKEASNKKNDDADSPSSQDEGSASSEAKSEKPSSAASTKQNNKKGKK
ncbi:MAG: AI-2E family transporter [Pirellulales bacterium]